MHLGLLVEYRKSLPLVNDDVSDGILYSSINT